jgi:4-amino-4-deoxy-L-arabinose transferase-like glycosyltransferase
VLRLFGDRFRGALLVLAIVGAAHGLFYVPLLSKHKDTDSDTYLAAAHAILHQSYTTPLDASFVPTPTGPLDRTLLRIPQQAWSAPERQTFRTPGYPLFLAALGGGAGGISEGLVFAVQGLLVGASIWLLGLTMRRIAGERVALASCLLYVLDPYSKRYVGLVLTEGLAPFLALAVAYVTARAWQLRSARGWWAAAAALAAVLALVRPVFILAVALVALAALVVTQSWRGRVRSFVAVLAAATLVLGPWLAWNHSVVGRFTLTTYTDGWTLLEGASGEGLGKTASQVESTRAFARALAATHRFAPPTSALLSDPSAHPRYLARADAELRNDAIDLYRHRLRTEPVRVAWELVYRSYFLWMAHEDWYQPSGGLSLLALRLFDWTLLGLALIGGTILLKRDGYGRALVLFLVAYTLLSALSHSEARFGIPLRGLYLSLAALALVEVSAARARRADST